MEILLAIDKGADVWVVDDDARGVREVRNTLGQVLAMLPRKAPVETEAAQYRVDLIFGRPRLRYAERHPRVYRHVTEQTHHLLGQVAYPDVWRLSRTSLKNLCIDMADVFRRVEPDKLNANLIYGHEIRNLLALACMEVESSWRAVLRANHYLPATTKPGAPPRYTTADYVKLAAPLRLAEYSVQLAGYSNIDEFAPFDGWDSARPTESLPWYDAYNETKHDREANFRSATMLRMIHALGAAHVMMHAQFGQCAGVGVGSIDRNDFYVAKKPTWPLDERYVPPSVLRERSEVWKDVDLPL